MINFNTPLYSYQYYYDPEKYETEERKDQLKQDLIDVGKKCFNTIPNYQCFKNLDSKVIVLVKDINQKPIAFASAVLLPMKSGDTVVHLGLVCIDPEFRKSSIMINLYNILGILTYETNYLGKKMWVTNCSCELSILKSVEKFFKEVSPSFATAFNLSSEQTNILEEVSTRFRSELYITSDIQFDLNKSIFKGSVGGTGFMKNFDKSELSQEELFYFNNLNYERGDELLQVGYWDMQIYERIKKTVFRRFLQQCLKSKKAM